MSQAFYLKRHYININQMKKINLLIIVFLVTQLAFSQQEKNAIEITTGYSNFDKNYDGAFLSAQYNVAVYKMLFAKGELLFAQGSSKLAEPFNAISATIGSFTKFHLSNNSIIKLGIDVGLTRLGFGEIKPALNNNLSYREFFFLFTYKGAISYFFKLNDSSHIGFTYSLQRVGKVNKNIQMIGISFMKSF
jgi:hypothetical protein